MKHLLFINVNSFLLKLTLNLIFLAFYWTGGKLTVGWQKKLLICPGKQTKVLDNASCVGKYKTSQWKQKFLLSLKSDSCWSCNFEVDACKWIVLKVVVNLLLPQCKIWGWGGATQCRIWWKKPTLLKEMQRQGARWSRSGVDHTLNSGTEDWEFVCGIRVFSTLQNKTGLECEHLELRN